MSENRDRIAAGRRFWRLCAFAALGVAITAVPLQAARYRTETITVRDKPLQMYIYDPAPGSGSRPVEIIVSSGDLGWIGLSVTLAEQLSLAGYRVIGFNARAYLSAFTAKDSGLLPRNLPGDFGTVIEWASRQSGGRKFVLIGVSEGAGLAALAMGQSSPNPLCAGIIALGMPTRTTLGWRWTDFPMWITKRDPSEPMAETRDYTAHLTVPVVMIHSLHDEWDSIDKARTLYRGIPGPTQFIAVDSVNHRFSDKVDEVVGDVEKSLRWIQSITGR
jgi:pimeloyl-ACP methyl ester carboxylesterase